MHKNYKIVPFQILVALFLSVFGFSSCQNEERITDEVQVFPKGILNTPKLDIDTFPAPKQKCLACHQGIEPIREHGSEMMQQIYAQGKAKGDPNGCVICHFGNPEETENKESAHKNFVKYPASVWVYDKTCGKCHEDHTYAVTRSLMQTEAGKIQGALWGWGATHEGDTVKYGNYDVDDPDGPIPVFGTPVYKEYMHKMAEKYPNNFPESLLQLPEADPNTIKDNPEDAVFTYLRQECLRCHVGVKGKQRRGDFRGQGCAACHIPYSDEGLYEGGDPTIDKTAPGHGLVHSLQSSRKVKVKVNDKEYTGIPSETCASCHNRGKRVGVSFFGMIESAYGTNWDENGNDQKKLHGKKYKYIKDDVQHNMESRDGNPRGGLLCQDCHTTTSVHGNGNIGGTTLGEIETECADCHGIPKKYPWELPIGYSDEYGMDIGDKPRGTTMELLDVQKKFSTIYPPEDGYILTARGNPYGNVVRRGDSVIVHSANGLDFKAPVLKVLTDDNSWENPELAIPAMVGIGVHIEKMECYSCHSTWAPQCYGCHVKVDFTEGLSSVDWLKTGMNHDSLGSTCEKISGGTPIMSEGKVTEGRSFVRWEDPVLGINGEGRVTPIIPGCQQITTVIDKNSDPLFTNKIWRTPPNTEGAGEDGQRGIDMTPAQPHTVSKKARTCVSCHANPKTLGYGVNDGEYMKGNEKNRFADIKDAEGNVLSKNSVPQFWAVEDLPFDLTQVVTRDGEQLQTVGHHWPLSSPLTQQQREKMERAGACIACHQDLPDGNFNTSMLSSAAEFFDAVPHTDKEHSDLINKDINLAAFVIVWAPIIGIMSIFAFFFVRWRKRRKV